MPQHTRPRHFYQVFADLARGTSEAARILNRILAEPHPFTELLAEMAEVERVSEGARHELVVGIDGATVTPLDREDVHLVASRLGGMVRLLHHTAQGVQDLGLTDTRGAARALAELLVRATGYIEESVAQIKRPERVVEMRTELERLTEEGLAVHDRATAALFAGTPDAIELLRWKEVFDALENAIIEAKSVQNVLSSIALENR